MKIPLIIVFVFTGLQLSAQKQIVVTENFNVEDSIKQSKTFSLHDLANFPVKQKDSLVITSHLLEKRSTLKNIRGVSLKDVLSKVIIDQDNPKVLSEYYIICIASDNYKAVFSWNEIFNTESGKNVLLINGYDGKQGPAMESRIARIPLDDIATGRRYIKGLQKIIIERIG